MLDKVFANRLLSRGPRTLIRYISFSQNAWLAVVACTLLNVTCSGCQTLHPFRNSVQQKAAVLREWTHSGLEAMQNGRLAQARSFFTRAASQSPHDTVARVNLARADARLGNLEEAIEHMRSAIELAPADAELLVELGELHFQAGQKGEASRIVKKALMLDSRSADAWALIGKLSHAAGNFPQALSEYQRSMSYSSKQGRNNDDVQMLMAQIYHLLGKPTRALSTVEQLLNRYPRDRQPEAALLVKANSLMQLNQFEPATDVLTFACSRDNASPESFIRLGEAQLSTGQIAKAQRTLQQAQQQHPENETLIQLAEQMNVANRTVVASNADQSVDGSMLR